jgi:serine/threonine-protein kinase
VRGGDIIQERYRLVAPLGRGGMAEVWRAADNRLQRSVAIKFLAPQLAEDPEFLVRFFAEAQAIARISHPNVVQVLDFGQHAGSPYLVMEFVPGGALTDRMGAPVPTEEAFRLIAAAARGAGAAHEAGIVHRDLKPANILLDESGEPKLADFGIAASSRSERLTATGAAIGSPHYISPEQASAGDASPRSDVYSLGIILYELLTGRRPFDGENITAVAIAQVEQEPTPPSSIVSDLDPRIDALMLKCLAKDPQDRFADGYELADVLSRGTGPLAVSNDLAEPVASKSGWANRKTLVGVVLILVALGAVAMGVVGDGDQAASANDDGYERLDRVGGLKIKKTRSPSPEVTRYVSGDPSPTPTKKAERPARSPAPEDEPRPRDRRPAPDPSPEPSEEEPTPEPTDEASPAP